ncbi:MAG: aldo/keto reductase, partial [Firmicutes bacterium]|nr:aldo/keto reductase [Bacillota bacterium]
AYGEAEEFVGRVVRGFRDDVCIATKVGVAQEGARFDLSPRSIHASCDMSLERLATDYIDLYQVHFDDGRTPTDEVAAAMESLKDAGKIREWGVCHLPAAKISEYCHTGKPFSVMMELSAVARSSRADLLSVLSEHGVAGIAFSTTGRGILTGSIRPGYTFPESDLRSYDPLFQREQFESAMRVADRIGQVARNNGKTPAQAAIAWSLGQPGIVCALTGPSTVAHLEENMGAVRWRIPREDIDGLERLFQEEDEWIEGQRRESISSILKTPVRSSQHEAFADLVYVLEMSVLLGLVDEQTIIPIFQRLCRLRGGTGEDVMQEMDTIRQEVAMMLPRSYVDAYR